jgi:hypothetical protein
MASAVPARRLAASVTCFVRRCVRSMRRSLPSPRPAAFPPHPPPPTWSALFGASSVVRSRPTPPVFRGGFALLRFPPRPGTAGAAAGNRRSPRFRRDPFVRELVSDPGRAAAPRITAPLMLPSALWTTSAPALSSFRGSIQTPHDCCVRFAVVVTFHDATLATGGRYPLPGRTSTGWTAPALPGAPTVEPAVLLIVGEGPGTSTPAEER